MGFGILFIGYFITFVGAISGASSLPVAPFTYLFGTAIIFFALIKGLVYQNKLFLSSTVVAVLLELVSIVVLILNFTSQNAKIYTIFVSIQISLAFLMHILLLFAIYFIAKEVGLSKIQARAIVNLVVSVLALVFMVLSTVLFEPLNQRFFLVGLTACMLFIIFTLAIIFKCYANICYEGDENMQKETTGVAIFDYLNSVLNKVINKNKNGKGSKK